jgi:twitching motility protein PilT
VSSGRPPGTNRPRLACLIDRANQTRAQHVLTIENPIEFVHEPKKSIIRQREVGQNTKSSPNALRAALREDPDIILVGEMRDYEERLRARLQDKQALDSSL